MKDNKSVMICEHIDTLAMLAITIFCILLVIFFVVCIECYYSHKKREECHKKMIDAYQECIDNWNNKEKGET